MTTIILAGYKQYFPEGPNMLNRHLAFALRVSKQPIVVVSGESSEELLVQCRTLEQCELVFDTSGEQVSLWSNLKASLAICKGPAVVHALEAPWHPPESFNLLQAELLRRECQQEPHLFQIVEPSGRPWGSGFPLGLTRRGASFLKRVKNVSDLADPCIQYEWLPISAGDTAA